MDTMSYLVQHLHASWSEIGKPERVLVAFSGGADSTALLYAFHTLSQSQRGIPRIAAAHINHGLRASADADESFARTCCKALSIPFHCIHVQLDGKSEEEARNARYAALSFVGKSEEAPVIALAHHAKDQAETFLLQATRGSVDGLGGMLLLRQTPDSLLLWRPFLTLPPQFLRQALLENSISWHEDESNANTDYLRNYIRHDVLSPMEMRSPGVIDRICKTTRILQEEHDFLQSLADDWLSTHAVVCKPCPFLSAEPFLLLHPALQKRVLRLFIKKAGLYEMLTYDQTCAGCSLKPGETLNLPLNHRLYRTEKRFHLLFPSVIQYTPAALCESTTGMICDGIHHQKMPRELYKKTMLRTRQKGDYIQPFGSSFRKPLQDYLVDRKVDRPFRDHLPLLCIGQEVIWAVGIGASEKARCTEGESIIYLYYPQRLPMELTQPFMKEI